VTAPFRLEPLHGQHDRSTFASGEEALDRYFRTQVTQDIRRRIANCFVAVDVATGQIVAYYTIASASIPTPDLPPRGGEAPAPLSDDASRPHRSAGGGSSLS
jgi:hypothetical protein